MSHILDNYKTEAKAKADGVRLTTIVLPSFHSGYLVSLDDTSLHAINTSLDKPYIHLLL